MRTRETVLCALLALATLSGAALAQEGEPTLNESDMNTSPPASDESYLDDAEAEASGEPTLSESDMDTTPPAYDESYLDEGALPEDGAAARGTPGLGVALVAVAGVAAALVQRRR